MDTNYILFLVAVLNLLGNLYTAWQLRARLPRWTLIGTILALCVCGAAWLLFPSYAGTISISVLLVYLVAVTLSSRRLAHSRRAPPPATIAILLLTIAAFIAQSWLGVTDHTIALIQLGALYGPSVLEDGEWWRLITAQFLHFNLLHVLFNMLGLLLLGPPVERSLGSVRFFVSYLASGIGGMAVALAHAAVMRPNTPLLLLGASASVLGVVGLQAAIALRSSRRTSSLAARAQLRAMVQIVLLQVVFDFLVPVVSSTAHLGGAATGFLLGIIPWWSKPLPPSQQAGSGDTERPR
jgi:membrane associated rhomboid family serine protease